MFQRLSLAQRMTLTTGSVVLVVMIAHALISERTMSAQVVAWEREQVAGIAHHVAEMVAAHRRDLPARTDREPFVRGVCRLSPGGGPQLLLEAFR